MQMLYDFFPIILFFIAYKFFGIYVATSVTIAACAVQVTYHRLTHPKFDKMQLATLIIILVLGSATLILHNPAFIKWKPTVVYWLFALAFLVSQFIGRQPLIGHVMGSKIQLPLPIWKRLNLLWALFFSIMGIANLYVATHYSTNTWVDFKLFGILGLTVVFALLQAIYLMRHIKPEEITLNSS